MFLNVTVFGETKDEYTQKVFIKLLSESVLYVFTLPGFILKQRL